MSARIDTLGLVGAVVDGRYRIEAVVGEGGHALVYRALHLALDLRLALKVLRRPGNVDIKTEARVLFKMCSLHSSFVQAKDTGQLITPRGEVAPYLVMEWLQGVSLAQQMRAVGERRYSLEELIQLLDAPSRGLAMAHGHGIVHRDLKPGNLFIADCYGVSSVKVLDFGLAKIQSSGAGTTSNLGNYRDEPRSFTPAYAAPEQWLQRLGATGTWTDVHAWALLCSELLSGQTPLKGNCDAQLMAACLDASHRPTPRTLGAQVSSEVERIFSRALAIEPRQRFRDIGKFWEALCAAAALSGRRKGSLTEVAGTADLERAAVSAKWRVPDAACTKRRTEQADKERTNPTWTSPMLAPMRSCRTVNLIRSAAISATLLFPNSQASRPALMLPTSVAGPTGDIPGVAAPIRQSEDEPLARPKQSAEPVGERPKTSRSVKGRLKTATTLPAPSASTLSQERSSPPDELSEPARESSEDSSAAAPGGPSAAPGNDVERLFNSEALSIRH